MRPKATPLSRGDIVLLLCHTDCCIELLAISVCASSTESRASCQNLSKTFTSQTSDSSKKRGGWEASEKSNQEKSRVGKRRERVEEKRREEKEEKRREEKRREEKRREEKRREEKRREEKRREEKRREEKRREEKRKSQKTTTTTASRTQRPEIRSQTSDNMDRWKSRGGQRQRGQEKK